MTPYRAFLAFHEQRQFEGRRRVAERGFVPDPVLVDEVTGRRGDSRYGVNVIARPPESVAAAIREIQGGLRALDGGQYFYPESDLHVTLLEILHGQDQPVSATDIRRIRDAVESTCAAAPAAPLVDGRIGFDESAVTLSCFPLDDRLDTLRDRLTAGLTEAGIVTAPRYRRKTAHITFVRYLSEVRCPVEWMEFLRARQEKVLPLSWEIVELHVTSGATWYGRTDRIEEHGPFALMRAAGKPSTS